MATLQWFGGIFVGSPFMVTEKYRGWHFPVSSVH
jgi:hypothetical protein